MATGGLIWTVKVMYRKHVKRRSYHRQGVLPWWVEVTGCSPIKPYTRSELQLKSSPRSSKRRG